MLATALALSTVKITCEPRAAVVRAIEALDLSWGTSTATLQPECFADLYHPRTWAELAALRRELGQHPPYCGREILALALGRMHGHSPGFFSSKTFNVVSLPPRSLKRLREKHGTTLPYRDVRALLLRAAMRFIPEGRLFGVGSAQRGDARDLPITSGYVDLVVTSPPFLDVIDYGDVNWVRQWMVDHETAGTIASVSGIRDAAV